MTNKKIGFVSLGCDKNRVDLEHIISKLSRYKDFTFVGDKNEAEIIIINTCAFIFDAREESFSVIDEMLKLKKTAKLQKLVVMGCLPLYDLKLLKEKYKEVDLFVTPKNYEDFDKLIFKLFDEPLPNVENEKRPRRLTTKSHYAYLKIADGCNNRCAFCKIPSLRGNYKSVDIETLVEEATLLCENGVKEIILVAQDVSKYGVDTEGKYDLVDLLKRLSSIKKLSWIRLLYLYPEGVNIRLINEIRDNPKVLNYVDIPLQHVSNHVLQNMHRSTSKKDIVSLINTLRAQIPDIKIRSTFMVGFPNETKEDYKELLDFLKIFKLENVGFFKFSKEEGTFAYKMEGQIDEKTKDKRLKMAQDLQEKIATKNNKNLIGNTFKVLCDEYVKEKDFYVGRPYFSAPDIDFEVLFTSSRRLKPGTFVDVKILDYKKGFFVGNVEKYTTY